VVQQLFRRELRQDPSHVIGVVREAIHLLPVASRDVRVRLHPEDAEFVRKSLPQSEGERAWTIVEDPMIDRGGCKVVTEQSQIDAQAESRLKAVIAAIVCDERR
jgi:flagellar assembly protein FliH